jgi:penicillin-binding protein 1C
MRFLNLFSCLSCPFVAKRGFVALWLIVVATGLLGWRTHRDLLPFPESLTPDGLNVRKLQILDRSGVPLSYTFVNRWNVHDWAPLHGIPLLLQQAFVQSEDQRFYNHSGVDWPARFHAVGQNLVALRVVRGASTITEQVVRMLHPRPRSFWSRWLETFEAARLEERFSKPEILEFYLNQVPYARQRRGAAQAARLYFDRDLDTLNVKETLALAVLVRSPASLDLLRDPKLIKGPLARLAARMRDLGLISDDQLRYAMEADWSLGELRMAVDAGHFVQHLYRNVLLDSTAAPGEASASNAPLRGQAYTAGGVGKLATTLDGSLQGRVQRILDRRLKDLASSDVTDGAVLVVDHRTDEVLAWVNGGGLTDEQPGGWIDAVTAPRQPGSTLKPFLYALALEMGWTPATIIDDSPLAEPVALGLHDFKNYSRTFHGPLRLRDALGNSLNVPAIRTIQFTTARKLLDKLHELGFQSLVHSPDHYGNGLALGNGEVSLFELVRAYAVLARLGELRPLRLLLNDASPKAASRRLFSEETASLIGDILSDPQARRLEFGSGHLLRLPVQTAVKTGTSNDHRDAWTVGFSHRYVVGVWMGNLDRRPTKSVTGTVGPALVLRAVFAELNRYEEPRPLALSRRLVPVPICRASGLLAGAHCPKMEEWLIPGTAPERKCDVHAGPVRRVLQEAGTLVDAGSHPPTPAPVAKDESLRLIRPTRDLHLAMDPHIPDELEAFALAVPKHVRATKIEWIVDGKVAGTTGADARQYLWPVSRGIHLAKARVWQKEEDEPSETPEVRFVVK